MARIVFARRTLLDGDVVIFTDRSGWLQLCTGTQYLSLDGPGTPVRRLPIASSRRPVIRLATGATIEGFDHLGGSYEQTFTVHRIASTAHHVQLRIASEGQFGPWFTAAVQGEYAFADAVVHRPNPYDELSSSQLVEDRAFDQRGRAVTIDRSLG